MSGKDGSKFEGPKAHFTPGRWMRKKIYDDLGNEIPPGRETSSDPFVDFEFVEGDETPEQEKPKDLKGKGKGKGKGDNIEIKGQ